MKARAIDVPVSDSHQLVMTSHGPMMVAAAMAKRYIGPIDFFNLGCPFSSPCIFYTSFVLQ